jgi:hypothetical protein
MSSEERGAASMSDRLVLWSRALGPYESCEAFNDAAASRFRVAGGEILAQLGLTLVASFEEFDAIEAFQLAMELLRTIPSELDCAIGAAFGSLEPLAPGHARGDAVDRAQWLCHRAGHGDLLADDSARALLSEYFLFAPPIGEEAGARRGHPVDRSAPTLPECRAAVEKLAPPALPRAYSSFADELAAAAKAEGTQVFLARGSSSALVELAFDHASRAARPSRVLPLATVPMGLEPLGSLRHGLVRLFAQEHDLDEASGGLAEPLRDALRAVRTGRSVDLALAARATADLLGQRLEDRAKSWIVVDPLPAIDVSTARLLRSLVESGPELLIVCRVPVESAVPSDALGRAPVRAWEIPDLGADGVPLAASILGVTESSDAAAFVAELGGSTPLGVIEAARTLVSRGDLVHDGSSFRFRQRLKPLRGSMPLSRLLAERLRGLETSALRVLDVVALCPPGTPSAVVDRALELDGLGESRRHAAIDLLRREAWISARHASLPSSEPLRASVLKLMAPARRIELQSFISRATSGLGGGTFTKVASATHARAAGESESPALALIEAAEEAKRSRHLRAALKLAATAVEWSRSPEIRRRAAEVARRDDAPTEPKPDDASGERASLSARWTASLRSRDFDLAERLIDEGVAEGAPLPTAETLRTWMALMRGDRALAREMAGTAWASSEHENRTRLALVSAWIDLFGRRSHDALTQALAVLASARRTNDRAAESAALATLATCFDAIDRGADAETLRQLAVEAASASRSLRSKSA